MYRLEPLQDEFSCNISTEYILLSESKIYDTEFVSPCVNFSHNNVVIAKYYIKEPYLIPQTALLFNDAVNSDPAASLA